MVIYRTYQKMGYYVVGVMLAIFFIFVIPLSSFESIDQEKLDQLSANSFPPDVPLLTSDPASISLKCVSHGFSYDIHNADNTEFMSIKIPGCSNISKVGHPALPYIKKLIAVPESSEYSLNISIGETVELEGISVLPAQREMDITDIMNGLYKDPDIYNQDSAFPSAAAEIKKTFKNRNQYVVEIHIYPLRINPVTNHAEFYKDISITVNNQNPVSSVCVPTGPFAGICKNNLINYSDDTGFLSQTSNRELLRSGSGNVDSCTSLSSCNGTDYLIIVGDSLWIDSTANYWTMELARKRAEYNGFNVCVINIGSIIHPDSIDSANADILLKEALIEFYDDNSAACLFR